MEIETKLRVDDPTVFDLILTMSALGDALLLAHPQPEIQSTTYYDTADESLRTKGASLRVREVAGQHIAAVKRSHGMIGDLHIRDEWETRIGAELHPQAWPPSIAREQALALLGHAALIPQVTVHTRRHRIAVYRVGRRVAEICLDEGHVAAAGRVIGFRELEVEQQGAGTAEDVVALSRRLAARFALVSEPLGKRSRGLALRAAVATGVSCEPVAAAYAVGS